MLDRQTIARRLAALAAVLFCAACSSANGAGSDRDASKWAWLGADGGTYWYVPADNLLAYSWQTDDPENTAAALNDQTVWHIDRYDNGYIFGTVAAQFEDYPVQCQYLIGSVTPEGRVYITFNSATAPPVGSPALTTGFGEMVRADGAWTFNMQMASGGSSTQVTHWAYMLECEADQPCWTDLPGSDESIEDFLDHCG